MEIHNRAGQLPAINQPGLTPEAPSSGAQAARVSTAQPTLADPANAPMSAAGLNRGRENLNGHSALCIDRDAQGGMSADDGFGQTATTRDAASALEQFPCLPAETQEQLTQVRELQHGLSEEMRAADVPGSWSPPGDARAHDNDLAANFTLPAEMRGFVEVDLPPGAPGTVAMEDGKTCMRAADYYLQVAQARREDLADREAQLVQQMQSNPTTRRALVERQSLSAGAGLQTLSSALDELGQTGGATPPPVDPGRIDRARQLLATAAAAVQTATTEPALNAALHQTDGDVAQRHHQAMEHYLGVKHPSSSEKRAAVEHFQNEVDRYLNGEAGSAPVLTGPDMSPGSALTPDEKVSLLVARTLETSIDPNSLDGEGKAMFKDLSNRKQVRKRVVQNVRQALRDSFEPVVKHISLPATDRSDPTRPSQETWSSVLTPAGTIGARLGAGEAFGSAGVLSSDTHSPEHVPNLWRVNYKGPNGNTLFRGVRHGTLSAFGINAKSLKALPKQELHALIRKTLPPERLAGRNIETLARQMTSRFSLAGYKLRNEARAGATMNRARELVKFNLLNSPQAMEKIRDGAEQVELEVPSIMLVTPDRGRRILGAFGILPEFDELRMTREQDRALKQLAAQGGIRMEFRNEDGVVRPVTVRLKPMNFSFGVNKMAFNKRINTLSPSWGNADAISRSSIERLVGKDAKPGQEPTSGLVAEHLERLRQRGEGGGAEEASILQLADQVTRLWRSKAHHGQNNEPYALPSRLALLTGKLGLTPSFNCKSGKDRTGQLDAEVKFLATRIERAGGQVPEPGADLSDEDKALYRTIVLNSGNHEIQKMNTGHAGYKVKLSSITRRLGGVLVQLQHLGQGKFTGA